MKRLLSSLLALLLGIYPATAAVVQITVKDAAGTSRNFNVTTNTDITGNLSGNVVLCDQSAGTTCASVGTAGSPSTNALTIQAVTLGHGTAANAIRVELPTDGTGVVTALQSGTWTVQPGNTANTTPWLFIGNQSNAADAVATGSLSVPSLAYGYGFNGTTWDRLRVDGSKNLNVNCVVGCSAASNITQIAGVTLGATAVTNYGTTPAGVAVPGVNAFVTNANPNGRAISGSSSPVVITPTLLTWHLIAAASTNATSVKASATTVYGCQLANNSATIAFLKIYNKASAPTVGTDVPVKTLIIPGPSGPSGGGNNPVFGPGGLTLGTGFATAITTGVADSDTGAVAATTYALNCDYE